MAASAVIPGPDRGAGWRRRGDGGDIARLDPEVQFLGQGVGEAATQVGDVMGAPPPGPGLKPAGQVADHVQVAGDQLGDAGPLYLQDDRRAVRPPGPVGLRERGGCHRLAVDLGEDLAHRGAKFLFQQCLDRGPRRGGDTVLQPPQFGRHRRGQQVGAGGQDLAELDEDRAALLERQAEPVRELAGRTRFRGAGAEEPAQPVPAGDPR